jgi:hypothetical protein
MIRNHLEKKGFVIGIILLFIGAGIIPNIVGSKVKQNDANESTVLRLFTGEQSSQKAFIFGTFTNMFIGDDYIIVEAVNLRMIPFKPFEYLHLINGEQITFSNQYNGIIVSAHFLFGLFVVFGSTPPQTPNIACTTDSTVNKITVATVDANVKWSDIEITTNNQAAIWQVFSAYGLALDIPNHTDGIITDVMAGDYIQLSGTTGNVAVTLRYIPTNALLGTWTVNV